MRQRVVDISLGMWATFEQIKIYYLSSVNPVFAQERMLEMDDDGLLKISEVSLQLMSRLKDDP